MEKDTFKKGARGYIPLHIYNHWLMGYLIKGSNQILVWDSAPSKIVKTSLIHIFNRLNWQATFLISPKQQRDSNECGLFAIRAAVRHQAGLACGSGWLSLAGARKPAFSGDIMKLREIFCASTCDGGSGPEWPLGRPWRSREEGLRYAEALRARARGEEPFFYEDNSGENRDDPIVVEDDEEEDNVDITLRVIEEAQKDTREREQRKKENREKEEKAQQVSVTKQDKRAESGNVQGQVLPQNGHTMTEKAPQVSVTKQEERTETGNVQGQVLPQSEHTMTEEEIAESIKTLKEGDKVEVIWLDGDDEITWHGHIVKKTRKRCTVLFDTTDGQVECLLPDDNVDYVRIRNPRHDDAESEDEMERSWSTISTNEEEHKTTGVHTAATTTTTAAPAPQTTRRPTPATTTAVTTREHKPGNLWPEWCSMPTEPLLGGETWPVHPRNWFIYAGRPPHVQSLAWSALSEDTRRLHVKWLHRLKAMPEELAATSPTFACAELIRRAAGAWSAATAHRNAVALSGAIRDLGMYTNQVGPGVRLGTEFQNMVRGLDRLRKATPPNPPPPIRFEEMEAILAATKNSTVKVLATLMWLAAARPSDILGLNVEDVLFDQAHNNNQLVEVRITVRRGKGAKLGGTYTIPTTMNLSQVRELEALTAKRARGERIFPQEQKNFLQRELRKAVKDAGGTAKSLPSIRKGAIRHLAQAGLPEATLRVITGHKTRESLFAYLGWGEVPTREERDAGEQTAALHAPLINGGGYKVSWPEGARSRRPNGQRETHCPAPARAPSRSELGLEKRERGRHDHLPLHLKETTKIDLQRAIQVGMKGLGFLDGSAFKDMSTTRTLKNNLWSPEDVNALVRMGRIEKAPEGCAPNGRLAEGFHGASIFTVPEVHKNRRRIITEPRLNGCFEEVGTERTIEKVTLPHRLQKRLQICRATYVASFDFSAFYDAFVMPTEGRKNFIVRLNNETYQLRTLPTGAKWSVLVAQSTTEGICRKAGIPDAIKWIDNVIITGMFDELVAEQVRSFIKTVRWAGIPLNAIEIDQTAVPVDEQITATTEWLRPMNIEVLGELYIRDEEEGGYRVQNTHKTRQKLIDVAKKLEEGETTQETLRVHMGRLNLILYAAHTVGTNPALLRAILQGSAHIGSLAAKYGWDATCKNEEVKEANIGGWCRHLAAHPPVKPLTPMPASYVDKQYQIKVMCDASIRGWGAIVHARLGGEEIGIHLQRRWREDESSLCAHSASAEPKACHEALQWLIEKQFILKTTKVAIITDHHAIPNAQRDPKTGFGGVGYGYFLNKLFLTSNEYPGIHFFYVPGEQNLADPLSRNQLDKVGTTIKVTETPTAIPRLKSFYCRYAEETRGDMDGEHPDMTMGFVFTPE